MPSDERLQFQTELSAKKAETISFLDNSFIASSTSSTLQLLIKLSLI
nr:MAG TPA: hypothetical protein [Bacteriophage sp.]